MNWKAGCGRTACPVWVEGDGQKPFSVHIFRATAHGGGQKCPRSFRTTAHGGGQKCPRSFRTTAHGGGQECPVRGHCRRERRKERWFCNPKGIVSSSPATESARLLWVGVRAIFNPNGVVSPLRHRAITPLGLADTTRSSDPHLNSSGIWFLASRPIDATRDQEQEWVDSGFFREFSDGEAIGALADFHQETFAVKGSAVLLAFFGFGKCADLNPIADRD